MNRALLRHNIKQSCWLLLACCTALFIFGWLRVWICSQLNAERFSAVIDLLPEQWQRFATVDIQWLVTYQGRISLVYSMPVVVLCMAVWAIARGSDSVSGQLGRGTLEMLLGQPLSRWQLLASHELVTLTGILLLAAAVWAGVLVGVHTTSVREEFTPTWQVPLLNLEVPLPLAEREVRHVPMREKVDPSVFVPASVNLCALGLMLAGLSVLLSALDRYRWRTIGLVVGFFVVEAMIRVAGMSADELNWLNYLTVLTAYDPERMVQLASQFPEAAWSVVFRPEPDGPLQLGVMGYHLVLALIGAVGYAIGAIVFWRRDVPAPV